MPKKKKNKDKAVGYGFVGRWLDGTLGWFMPTFVHDDSTKTARKYPCKPDSNVYNDGDSMYLCEITVKLVKDKNGRPIIRKFKNKDKK